MAILTKISNILNLMVQQPQSGLKFYHWGYRYDINREVSNNYDPRNTKGRQYPALQMDVPNVLNDLDDVSFDDMQQDVEMVLYFDNLQDYNNNGTLNALNTIEQFDTVNNLIRPFLANFSELLTFYGAGFIKSKPRHTPRSNLHNDKLITIETTFTITVNLDCVDDVKKMDLNAFPTTVSETDIENWKA